jgi:hypothetical protein
MNGGTSRAIGIGLTALLVAALCSCDDKKGTGATHQITGKLSNETGKPLSNVKVSVFGYPKGNQETFAQVAEIAGPADRYSVDVPEGTYEAPRANVSVTYNGRKYVLPLAAADNTRDWGGQKDSGAGLVRDFVWRVSGARPTVLGESKEAAGYWGAAINLDKGADVGDFGTIEVTLTPDGPLIDGSAGKVLSYKRVIPWQRHEDHLLTDVPIGRYVTTAKIFASGSEKGKPLRLVVTSGNPMKVDDSLSGATAEKVVVEFEQAEAKAGVGASGVPGQEPKLYVPSLLVFPEKDRRVFQ